MFAGHKYMHVTVARSINFFHRVTTEPQLVTHRTATRVSQARALLTKYLTWLEEATPEDKRRMVNQTGVTAAEARADLATLERWWNEMLQWTPDPISASQDAAAHYRDEFARAQRVADWRDYFRRTSAMNRRVKE